MEQSACDSCANYSYDEDWDAYVCDVDMDEDDRVQLLTGMSAGCPYYRSDNEYEVVRHQM